MINKLKYANVSDIGIYDLIFYDENIIDELIQFCKLNGITYLPSKDRKNIYKLNENQFTLESLTEDLSINPYDRIFEEKTLLKFNKIDHNEIRFIIENDSIRGVVHIIDYNSEFIQVELYRSLFRFEVNLRKLLCQYGYENDDFISWVCDKAISEKNKNSQRHWKQRLESLKKEEDSRREFKQFQTFYLQELLRFASDKKVINKKYINIDSLHKLRNRIAHSNDLTTYKKDEDKLLYNYSNLEIYIKQINDFFVAFDYLNDKMILSY